MFCFVMIACFLLGCCFVCSELATRESPPLFKLAALTFRAAWVAAWLILASTLWAMLVHSYLAVGMTTSTMCVATWVVFVSVTALVMFWSAATGCSDFLGGTGARNGQFVATLGRTTATVRVGQQFVLVESPDGVSRISCDRVAGRTSARRVLKDALLVWGDYREKFQ